MKHSYSILFTILFTTLFAVGCGASYRGQVDSNSNPDTTWQWPDGNGDGSDDGDGSSDIAAPEYTTFSVAGSDKTSYATGAVVVDTDDTLKVHIDTSNMEILAGAGMAPRPVGCVKVSVTVNGLTKTTSTLQTGSQFGFAYYGGDFSYNSYPTYSPSSDSSGPYYTGLAASNLCCANAGTTATLDFSSHIRNRGSADVTVQVTNVSYSHEDRVYQYYGVRCGSLASVYSTHVVSGEFAIETDYTSSL